MSDNLSPSEMIDQHVQEQAKKDKIKWQSPLEKKLRKIFNVNTKKRKMVAAGLSVALLGGGAVGGTYGYQEMTKYDTSFTVQSTETRIEENCQKTMSILDDGRTVTDEKTGETHDVDPVKKVIDNECSMDKTYLVHTDKGTFENASIWLQGKSNDDANRLQEMFQTGVEYDATVTGSKKIPFNDAILDAKKTPPKPPPSKKRPILLDFNWKDFNSQKPLIWDKPTGLEPQNSLIWNKPIDPAP